MTALAAVWSGSAFSLQQVPFPDLADGEVLVEIELSTVCGSDLHTVAGHRSTPVPTVLGHESVGRVVDIGTGATVAVGDRVVWTVGTACGACRRCVRGVPQKCVDLRKYGHAAISDRWILNGGFATHIHLLAGTRAVVVPEDLPAALLAPAGCATATVVCAARRIGLAAGDAVVVLGCGMLGLTAVAYALDRGATSVLACDPNPARRAAASEIGATAVCAPEELADIGRGADAIFELSGSSSSVAAALEVVGLGGRIVLVGSVFPSSAVAFDPEFLVRNLVTVSGSHNYAPSDLVEAVEFLQRTPAAHLLAAAVGERHPLEEIDAAFASGRSAVRGAVG
ncbi:alcohol dehydrogenase [Rhodococcus sp. PAMC28707]|uniref:zinc-binding dehydrogenase n=1 Tax=unclassified Rhodococcus (in: high G+C Gram-positive bacteria) TaxID=192944 RepID=UPI00109DA03F|nr:MULTISPECIES: zinc-binding dehydrogenase [unclassified Rhodococcus (in: high G+C Gram-positive bacteria)]QCB49856.1 alcohol dehydrogenase [Rhodococcus sp. PAMC28705]QCB58451.1 alcohol dehydrogenase [Rhodococcus sp. PAMC28707]